MFFDAHWTPATTVAVTACLHCTYVQFVLMIGFKYFILISWSVLASASSFLELHLTIYIIWMGSLPLGLVNGI